MVRGVQGVSSRVGYSLVGIQFSSGLAAFVVQWPFVSESARLWRRVEAEGPRPGRANHGKFHMGAYE